MLTVNLTNQIYEFIEAFMVVEQRQVMQFFKEPWGKLKVEYELGYLKRTSRIFEHRMDPKNENEPVKLSVARTLHTPLRDYRRTIAAVSVLCKYRCDEINFFDRVSYPSEILFVTSNDVVYEVGVFDSDNWVSKFGMIQKARGKNLPDGEQDPTNYIAVVPSNSIVTDGVTASIPADSMIRKIDCLGFQCYATVDRNGHADIYEV